VVIEVMNRLSVRPGISGKEFHCYVVCTFPIFLSRIELRKLDAPGNDREEEVKRRENETAGWQSSIRSESRVLIGSLSSGYTAPLLSRDHQGESKENFWQSAPHNRPSVLPLGITTHKYTTLDPDAAN